MSRRKLKERRIGWLTIACATTCSLILHATARAQDRPAVDNMPSVATNAEDAGALRSYLAGNGLLNRGQFELAAREYRAFLAAHSSHEKAAAARYGLAVCLYRLNQHAAALDELRQCADVRGFEFAIDARVLLARCLLATDKAADAIEPLQKVMRDAGSHELADDAAALLIEAYARGKQHDLVIAATGEFEQKFASSALRERVLLLGGLAHAAREQWNEAAAVLKTMLDAFPKSPLCDQAGIVAAQCLDRAGKLDDAAAAYRAATQREGSKHLADAWLGLARVEQSRGNNEAALEAARRVQRDFMDSPQAADAAMLIGEALVRAGKGSEADAALMQAARSGGDRADAAAYWLAKSKLQAGRFAEAARGLEAAITAYPKSELRAAMQYDLAVALLRDEKDEPALAALQRFIDANAWHEMLADALAMQAGLLQRLKRYDEARAAATRVTTEFPQFGDLAGMEFLAAESAYLAGSFDAAAIALRKFVDARTGDPRAAKAAYRLGLCLIKLSRTDEARDVLIALTPATRTDPTLRGVPLALGEIAFERKQWAQAERAFADYLKFGDAPDADLALLKRGIALAQQSEHEKAIDAFDELFSQFSTSEHAVHARFERGQSLLARGRHADAAAEFERVVADPQSAKFTVAALNHLAGIELRATRYDRSIELATRGLESKPDDAVKLELLRTRGQARLALGKASEAESDLSQLAQSGGENSTAAQLDLIAALLRQDRHSDVLERIRQMEQSGLLGSLDDRLRGRVLYARATCLRKLDQIDKAAAVFRTLVELAEAGAEKQYARAELAEIEAAAGRCEAAIPLLLPLVKAGDGVPAELALHASYRLGACLLEIGKHADSADVLRAFADQAPTHALARSARYLCGEANAKLGKHAAAIEQFKLVLAKPEPGEITATALLRMGDSHAALGNWAASEEAFERYLRENVGERLAYQAQFGVGLARENQGRHDEAIKSYRAVIEKHNGPTAARAQFQIGECLFAKKQHEEAAVELLKVDILYAYPEWSAAALFEAGRCFEAQSKTAQAREQYKAVADRFGDTRWAKLAADRMRELRDETIPGK
ncbi:MAG: tetratricopeptide repeat protein [Phycisphaerae bacterium]